MTGARSVVSLSSFFVWALDAALVDSNPCIGVRTAKTASREHVPSDRDLAAIWNACDGDGAFGQIIRLLLLTGTRRSELGDLAWGEVDLEERVIVIPGTRMKNRREHRIALLRRSGAHPRGHPASPRAGVSCHALVKGQGRAGPSAAVSAIGAFMICGGRLPPGSASLAPHRMSSRLVCRIARRAARPRSMRATATRRKRGRRSCSGAHI